MVQISSVQSLDQLGRRGVGVGGGGDDLAEILVQSFLQEALVSSSDKGRDVHSIDVHPAFPLPTTASPTLQGALKDGFREAVVTCDMPKPCEFPEEAPVDPQGSSSCAAPSRWFCAPSRRCGEISSSTWFRKHESFFFFFRVRKQGPCFTAMGEDGDDKRLVELELACEADGVAP